MTRFRFPLERVLSLRRIDRDRETAKLEEALAAQRAVEHRIERLGQELERSRQEAVAAGPSAAEDLSAASLWRSSLREAREALVADLDAASRRTADQRRAVAEAERRVKLLERLESARRQEWRAEADRELELSSQELWLARWRKPGG